MSGIARPGPRSMEPTYLVNISAGHRPLTGSGRRVRSSCVPLSPAVARTYGGQGSRHLRGFLWASGGPADGAEGSLGLAGDLVAAGYAVRVDGEQGTHAVPGAGSDLGGRGAGGQPQRECGMAQVVGAAHRLGACPVLRHGRGAGLVPDPAVEAFAERADAGTPEQPPIFGASEGLQVPAEEAGKLRGIGTVLMVPSGRCLRLRGSRGVPLPVQARADRGRDPVSVSRPQQREGRMQESARSTTASAGRSAA